MNGIFDDCNLIVRSSADRTGSYYRGLGKVSAGSKFHPERQFRRNFRPVKDAKGARRTAQESKRPHRRHVLRPDGDAAGDVVFADLKELLIARRPRGFVARGGLTLLNLLANQEKRCGDFFRCAANVDAGFSHGCDRESRIGASGRAARYNICASTPYERRGRRVAANDRGL